MYHGLPQFGHLLRDQPTVGALVDMCEENYDRLQRLIPGLAGMQGGHCSCRTEQMDLHLEVLEQSRFTTRIRLTHFFTHAQGREPDPDMEIRVYHDARQVEVLDLRQHILPTENIYQAPGLLNKWRANLFLAKWLIFCLSQGHTFDPDVSDKPLVWCEI